jgi:hypothetical protein
MLRFWKMLLVYLALAGLPVQVAATAMAFCPPDQHAHTHAHGDMHDHASLDADESQPPAAGTGSDEVLCHHTGAAALPGLRPTTAAEAAADPLPGPVTHPFLFFPEQPKPPPLA